MVDWLVGLSPWQQALAGTIFTYGMTALGAALVFSSKKSIKCPEYDAGVCLWRDDRC